MAELFDVKNNYYLGHYQSCLNNAAKTKVTDASLVLEKEVFVHRAYVAQRKFNVVLDEISVSSPEPLKAVKMLAEYLARPQARQGIVSRLDASATDNVDPTQPVPALMAAHVYFLEENYEQALRVLSPFDDLEPRALNVQIFLRMNRVDLARKELKAMQDKEDDATLTQLAQAWINLAAGGEKLQDAYYTTQELIDKFGSSPLLLNQQAVSFIGQGKMEEALGALQDALEKDPNYADTLINMVVLSQSTGKAPEVSNRHLSQLRDAHPEHPFLKAYSAKEREFDKVARAYAPSVSA